MHCLLGTCLIVGRLCRVDIVRIMLDYLEVFKRLKNDLSSLNFSRQLKSQTPEKDA